MSFTGAWLGSHGFDPHDKHEAANPFMTVNRKKLPKAPRGKTLSFPVR
jgi:hypothetical protein